MAQTHNVENDIPQQIGWDYHDSLQSHYRDTNSSKTQIYTPVEVADFLVKSSVPMAYKKFKEEGKADIDFRLLDPCCGGGIFPLIALRYLDDLMPLSKKEIVENCILCADIDLGAVNTTKRTLYAEVGEKCVTKCVWGDFLSEFYLDCRHLEDITNLFIIDGYNKILDILNTSYMAECNKNNTKLNKSKIIDTDGSWCGFLVYTNWDKEGVFDNSEYEGALDEHTDNLQKTTTTSNKPKLDAYLVS